MPKGRKARAGQKKRGSAHKAKKQPRRKGDKWAGGQNTIPLPRSATKPDREVPPYPGKPQKPTGKHQKDPRTTRRNRSLQTPQGKAKDEKLVARPPGKRFSIFHNRYYEYRPNRTDKRPSKKV